MLVSKAAYTIYYYHIYYHIYYHTLCSEYWQLELEGINYSFELFLNGSPVPVSWCVYVWYRPLFTLVQASFDTSTGLF